MIGFISLRLDYKSYGMIISFATLTWIPQWIDGGGDLKFSPLGAKDRRLSREKVTVVAVSFHMGSTSIKWCTHIMVRSACHDCAFNFKVAPLINMIWSRWPQKPINGTATLDSMLAGAATIINFFVFFWHHHKSVVRWIVLSGSPWLHYFGGCELTLIMPPGGPLHNCYSYYLLEGLGLKRTHTNGKKSSRNKKNDIPNDSWVQATCRVVNHMNNHNCQFRHYLTWRSNFSYSMGS